MELVNKNTILKELPLFANLTQAQRNIIKERCQIVEYKKDEVIYQEGQAPSSFYLIAVGRMVIYTSDKQGHKTTLEYLHRGKYFGIISLLTGEPHSVTAQAVNDCLLLVVKNEDFQFILKNTSWLLISARLYPGV